MALRALTGCFWDSKTRPMVDAPDKIRAFVAIPVPGHVRRMLGNIQSDIQKTGIQASWPNPDTFHLTLKFLGPVRPDILARVKAVMERFSGACPDLTLTAGSIGFFPGIRNARVIWADIKGQTPQLSQLFRELDTAFHALGFSRQANRFSPHITLARLKAPVPARTLICLMGRFEKTRSNPFHARHMNLYKSVLTPRGAVHTCLFQVIIQSESCSDMFPCGF
jgi:RNA 2',3'-cyclic 3'-phosphodiesterase